MDNHYIIPIIKDYINKQFDTRLKIRLNNVIWLRVTRIYECYLCHHVESDWESQEDLHWRCQDDNLKEYKKLRIHKKVYSKRR